MKRVLQTIVRDNERYSISNSSELSISKPDLYIEKIELQGGETATTDDIVVTRSGKNLLDGNLRTTPEELGGITIQYLPDEDCYLINGTCTGSNTKYIIFENIFVDDIIKISTIHLSGSVTIPSGYAIFYTSYRDNLSDKGGNWASAKLENDVSKNNIKHTYIGAHWFYVSVGVSFDNYKVKIQIEKGNNATEYEPYLPPKSLTFSSAYPLSSTDKLSITRQSVKYNDTDITSEITGLDGFFGIDANVSTVITNANIALGEITEDISYSVKSNKRAVLDGDKVIYSSQTFIKE